MKHLNKQIIIALVFISLNVKAQERPILDANYISNEFDRIIKTLSIPPKNRSLSIYLSSGVNQTKRVNEVKNYQNTFQSEELTQSTNQTKIGCQISFGVLKPISKHIDINVGIKYGTNIHSISYSPYAGYETNIAEKNTTYSIPIKGRYSYSTSSFRPFIELGARYSRVISSQIDANRNGGQSLAVNDIDIIDLRNRNLYSLNIGIGLEYSFYRGDFFVLATYNKGLSQLNVNDKQFDNDILRDKLRYVSPDFTLNSIEFSIGYSFFILKKE